MKYNMHSLDLALDYLLPPIAKAKREGISFDRPSLCKMAAAQQFVKIALKWEDKCDFSFKQSYQTGLCEYVIAEALNDLNTHGHFEFGDKVLEEHVNLEGI